MKRNPVTLLIIFLLCLSTSFAQQKDSLLLLTLNQTIDDLVVKRDTRTLEELYAEDFVFSHGTGKVEGRESWLKSVQKAAYPSRQHDSVKVELHRDVAIVKGQLHIKRNDRDVAIVKGQLHIKRNDRDKVASYHLRYIRVYALRGKQWQMISHSTTEEKHDN